jgi:hypothetical protein
MNILDKCRKYKTFMSLKYGLRMPQLSSEFTAIWCCNALLSYDDQFENLNFETLLEKIQKDNDPSSLKDYCTSLKNHFLGEQIHKETIELIELNINTSFSTKWKNSKIELTTNKVIITTDKEDVITLILRSDGKLNMTSILSNDKEYQKNFIFESLNELDCFIKNLKEYIELDDSVLKMAII